MHHPDSPFPTYNAPRDHENLGENHGPPTDPGSRGLAAIAWISILALIGVVLVLNRLPPPAATGPVTVLPPDATMTLMGRYAMGAKSLTPANTDQLRPLVTQLDTLAVDRPEDRLRAAIIAGELMGPEAARERIDEILADHPLETADAPDPDGPAPISPELESDLDLVRAISRGEVVDRDAAAHAGFIERHRWFGRLALTQGESTADPARAAIVAQGQRTTGVMLGIVVLAIALGVVGLVMSIIALTLFAKGRLRGAYAPPAPGGSVYLEAFAVFMGMFLVVNIVAGVIEQATGTDYTSYLIWLVPLTAFYPLLRGQPWSRHRYAIGWHTGRGVFREIGAASVGYLAGLPIVAAGVGITLLLMFIWGLIAGDKGGGPPTHPVIDKVASGGVLGLLGVLLLASVWAPLTEETLFRGALYHHLRGRLRPFFGALIVGLIFAVIHPQGFLAVPALASLGFVFCLMREWRGSIIAPAVAHGLHNGTVVVALWLALS